ncbi:MULTISPECIES: GNAT family N-acetyltransferase [Acinetobacter]|uniref:GNAT family N-acetyltransferase n=1 Tax=Acinetobacter TaxID=469 RepID=UPI001444453A|nr:MULTISPECIES: GNAT family N-acetyltransferase [Acinetobacter]
MTAISIVPLAQTSQPQWHALWAGYQAFYQTKLSDKLSAHTWQRLTSAESAHMYGFAALFEQQMVGFVHVIEHDSCWTFRPYAYLQDLFTHPDYRGQGVARLLIEQVYMEAKKRQCDRVYWLTQEANQTAQILYDKVAHKTGFIQYKQSL